MSNSDLGSLAPSMLGCPVQCISCQILALLAVPLSVLTKCRKTEEEVYLIVSYPWLLMAYQVSKVDNATELCGDHVSVTSIKF